MDTNLEPFTPNIWGIVCLADESYTKSLMSNGIVAAMMKRKMDILK